MANGTNNSFAPGFGFGFDKPINNPYGAPVQQTSTATDPAQPMYIFPNPIQFPFLGGGGGVATTPTTRDNTEMISIPSGIGTYNVASTQFQDLGGPDLQKRTAPSFSPPTSPTTGGGFGDRFKDNMSSPEPMAGMASGIGGIIQGLTGRRKRKEAQAAAQSEYDKMRRQYMDLDTSNIYAGVRNKYLNMENPYEDLTVNQQQAEFEKRMFEQQQAGIMQNLRGAAGGSGIAGLAQALSNQALVQSQKAAGSIGLQESRNQIYKAQEASRIQQLERRGEAEAEAMRLAGVETARGLEWQKTGTVFGMAQQDLAAANQAIAQADAALYGGIGSLVGTAASAAIGAV